MQSQVEPGDENLQSYAEHQTKVFDSLRNSIKREGNMFLFGNPTDAMVKLMLKIYHENILRVLSKSKDSDPKPKLKCMFGIMHARDANGTSKLLCTISETPGLPATNNSPANLPSDPDYMNKRKMMLNILESANVSISYPETESTIQRPIFLDENRWRNAENSVVKDSQSIRTKIEANNGKIKNVMFYNSDKEETIDIYYDDIRDLNINVEWVDSYEYLARRRNHEETFPPYKKYSKMGNGTWRAECNNGHLCTESKLFGYAHLNKLKPISFVAYWVGDSAPPENHILPKYSYRTIPLSDSQVRKEDDKLNKLMEQCKRALVKKDPIDTLETEPKFDTVLKNAVQPIAIACPGCFANIQAYIKGNMKEWNNSNCYVPRRLAQGGKRKTRKLRSKKRKMTRRR